VCMCVLLRVTYVSMGEILICGLYMSMNAMTLIMDVYEYFIMNLCLSF
jgi:hypothetical protein